MVKVVIVKLGSAQVCSVHTCILLLCDSRYRLSHEPK